MLVDIKARVREVEVAALLAYAVFPDPDHLLEAIRGYDQEENGLLGYMKDEQLIGIVGYAPMPDNGLRVVHIAVDPAYRDQGYGRHLLLALIEQLQPAYLQAETDSDAVDFYRNIGFEIVSLGEKYAGVERFSCTFLTDYEQTER